MTANDTAIRASHFLETKFAHSITSSGSTYKIWRYTLPELLGRTPRFECGVSTLTSNGRCNLVTSKDSEINHERLFVVAKGSMDCTLEGSDLKTAQLESTDCLYLPPGASCTAENKGDTELVLGWASAKSDGSRDESAQVIKTLKEVAPVKLEIKGLERSIYRIKQSKGFHFAIFTRGANTYSPLHTHEPKYFEEAFIVIKGKLWVTGLNDQTSALNEFDFAYVPPYGGNLNENKSNEPVTYAWIGAPPIDMKEIPVDREFSKFEDKMALDKAK